MAEALDIEEQDGTPSRREFLRGSTAAVGGALLAGVSGMDTSAETLTPSANIPPNIPEWMKSLGDPVGSQLYGAPSPFEKSIVRNVPKSGDPTFWTSSRSPLQELDGIITPNGLFYERHHAGIPSINPNEHRLMLHGLVERPLIFTMDDTKRFPS